MLPRLPTIAMRTLYGPCPAQTTLLRSCQLSDSSRCFVRPVSASIGAAAAGSPLWPSRAAVHEHEQRAAAPPRQALCIGWHRGPRALSPSLGTSGTATRVRLGQMTVTSFGWDRCKKSRKDSFYNLPPPNSLNRGGVAILIWAQKSALFFGAAPLCNEKCHSNSAAQQKKWPISGLKRPFCIPKNTHKT